MKRGLTCWRVCGTAVVEVAWDAQKGADISNDLLRSRHQDWRVKKKKESSLNPLELHPFFGGEITWN